MNFLEKIAFGVFGKRIERKKIYYYGLQKKLREARISIPYDRYVSISILYSLFIGIFGCIFGYTVAEYLLHVWEAYRWLFRVGIRFEYAWITGYRLSLIHI